LEKEAAQKEADENAIAQQENQKNEASRDLDRPNVIRKDNTTVSYFLEGRWHSYIYIPTYKCQGGGTVLLDIVINPNGRVISAIIQENKSTADPCLREEAYRSAVSAQFNADPKASAKQLGTMTYVFLAQ
jgi:TonB family protein